MDITTENSSRWGKAIEHYIIHELLKNNFEVFIPVVDDGVDMIVKDKQGGYVDIQVKSRNITNDEDFFYMKDFKPALNFFIVCHNINKDGFIVIPSIIYDRHSHEEIINKKKRKAISFKKLKMYGYHDKKGLDLLKKALNNPFNKISSLEKIKEQIKENESKTT